MPKKKPVPIPILVKHCALAIYKSGDVKGSILQKVYQSLLIARSRLTEYGYLKKGSEKGGVETIKLTGKGQRRESFHQREKGGVEKTALWDQLYLLLEGATHGEVLKAAEIATEDEKPVDASATPQPVAVNPRDARKVQRLHRLAKAAKSAAKPRAKRARRPQLKKAKKAKKAKKKLKR
jgi:hypothetical protein